MNEESGKPVRHQTEMRTDMSRNTATPADVISARSRLVSDLLANHFPTFRTRTNDLDKRALAAAMGLSHETIYRAVRGIEEMKLATARKLVKFSRENQDAVPLYLLPLMPFVIHDWAVAGEASTVADLDLDDLLADDTDDLLA
jgi:hypothetical protein